jgi:hypothetical protein
VSLKSTGSCGTIGDVAAEVGEAHGAEVVPSIVTRPAVASKNRGTRLANVLLPAPLGPTRAQTVPAGMRADVVEHGVAGLVGKRDPVGKGELAAQPFDRDRGGRIGDG